jgi:hypothetical protein
MVEYDSSEERSHHHAAPNPVHGEMRLRWDATDDRSAGEMIISDESGREIEHQRVEAGATQAIWRTAGVARGVYLAVLRIGTRVATVRLVVK